MRRPARSKHGGRWCLVSLVCILTLLSTTAGSAQDIPDPEKVRWQRQIAYVQSLILNEPSLPQHYIRLAQAYAKLGMETEVLHNTAEAVRRGQSPLSRDILLGDFYSDQERYDDALHHYLRVLAVARHQAHTLTQVWLIVQRHRAADLHLRADIQDLAMRLNGAGYHVSDTRPTNDREGARQKLTEGNRYLNAGNTQAAVGAYMDAATDDPWNPDVYRGLGIAHARDSDYMRAVGAYHLYVALAKPGTPDVAKVRQIIIDFYRRSD